MPDESGINDPYDLVLSDLYAKRDQINAAIAAIEAMRGAGTGAAPSAQRQESPSDHDLLGLSIADAAKKLLAAKRKPMRNPELATLFKAGGLVLNSKEPANTIGSVLTRRFMEVGDIVRVERGTWGLKEWYPNRSFKTAAAAKIDGSAEKEDASTNEPSKREYWKTRQKREREEAAKAASAAPTET